MLAEAQEAGQILDEEQRAFLADPGIPDDQTAQTTIPNNAAFQTGDLDAYDSDCDDVSNAKAVLMANLSNNGSDVILEVPHSDSYHNDIDIKIKPILYDGSITSCQHVASPVFDDEETLILEETHQSASSPVKIEAPWELPKVSMVNTSFRKLKYHLGQFDNVVKKRITPDAIIEEEWGESCVNGVDLDAELLNKQNAYNDLSKSYSQLEKHFISLELTTQINQEIFQKDSLINHQNSLEIPKYFENNNFKAQLPAKDTTICKLKEHIKTMRENDKEEKVKHEMDEIETINIELEHNVTKLLSKNERLHKEIKHLKKIYKDQFDSFKKTRALSKEHNDSLIAQLNSKLMANADLKIQLQDKIDLEPLAPMLLNNKEAHIDYLKHTQEQADILQGIVKQAKAKQPLDNALDFTCSNATDVPSSSYSLVNDSKFLGTVRFENNQVAKIMGDSFQTLFFNTCDPPNRDDWDRLFQPMFHEYFNPSTITVSPVPVAVEQRAVDIADSHVSTSIDLDAPSTNGPLHESLHEDSTSHGSSSNVRPSHTPFKHLGRWTKDHPIENIVSRDFIRSDGHSIFPSLI
nr:hypothetical protein [Tanacetum cinerariifolium]